MFGQKITHALRSSLMDKFVSLTADSVNKQEPGTLVSRFVGDVDTVENLFTSGIISMFADVCKIISILVVIWFQNRGLTLVLLVLLPFLFWFTRHVQKICWRRRLKTERLSDGHPVMCRRRFTISAQSIVLQRKHTWKSVTTLISGRVMQRWSAPIFMMRFTPGDTDIECGGCRSCHAAFRVRKPHGTDLLWNVCRNCGCGHQLYLTDILPGGEPRNGDSDDSVCDCRNPQDQ